MKYLFGPVNSRRLGLSLGIDLLPNKTCSLNCIYCECGKTANLTTKINEYVSADSVIIELKEFLSKKPELDIITFSGSGEPTLHKGIGKIIKYLKENFPEHKVAILTNSTLLHLKKVRKSILDADIIIPSLNAVNEDVFNRITRPAKGITANKIIEGLISLRKEFKNSIIIEIFIVPGLNDNEKEISLIKSVCEIINPDMIQLNTLDRPGSEKWLLPSTQATLREIKKFLEPLKVTIIENPKNSRPYLNKKLEHISDIIISIISRRPSTIKDLADSLKKNQKDILKIINHLLEKNLIIEEKALRGSFYRLK